MERAGHTEASVDIVKLAKLNPSAVICEVMNQDGRMARLKDLVKFSKKHKIKIASISDLIAYRFKNEKLITNTLNSKFNTKEFKNCDIKTYKNNFNNLNSVVIKKGILSKSSIAPVRVLSTNLNKKNFINDIKIMKSLKFLNKSNKFVLILIQDKKSIKEKIIEETSKSNILRYYGFGAQIIKDLGLKKIILVSSSLKKIIGLEGYGIKIIKQKIIK